MRADGSAWTTVYDYEGKPAWLWTHGQIPPSDLSPSLRRDVYTKATRGGQAVRELVA